MKKKAKDKVAAAVAATIPECPVWVPSKKDWEYQCRNPSCLHSWKTVGVSPECCPACGQYNFHLVIKEVSHGTKN